MRNSAITFDSFNAFQNPPVCSLKSFRTGTFTYIQNVSFVFCFFLNIKKTFKKSLFIFFFSFRPLYFKMHQQPRGFKKGSEVTGVSGFKFSLKFSFVEVAFTVPGNLSSNMRTFQNKYITI